MEKPYEDIMEIDPMKRAFMPEPKEMETKPCIIQICLDCGEYLNDEHFCKYDDFPLVNSSENDYIKLTTDIKLKQITDVNRELSLVAVRTANVDNLAPVLVVGPSVKAMISLPAAQAILQNHNHLVGTIILVASKAKESLECFGEEIETAFTRDLDREKLSLIILNYKVEDDLPVLEKNNKKGKRPWEKKFYYQK